MVDDLEKERHDFLMSIYRVRPMMRGLEDAKEGRISKIDAEILEDGIEYERDNPDDYLDDDLIPDF